MAITSSDRDERRSRSVDRKTLQEINRMIEEPWRDAGQGIGKPGRLSGDLSGLWSRRITVEHRLVHEVVDGAVVVH
ncbi:Txe/YoeB family addiction module toxin [Kineococcus terrestris]|uniref:Txe/YoeB family addiction module toxin n=1 Tax=Kineococcus terrestris TaxID=2044856 RepID=UPI0034DB0D08